MNTTEINEKITDVASLSTNDFWNIFKNENLTQNEKDDFIFLRCATDIELFSYLFFPHYCTRPFNPFHKELFLSYRYNERNVRRARAAPRGSAKSTLETLIKPIHDACYGLEKFILILSSTTPLANKKLKDIRAEIISNGSLQYMYGVHFPHKKAGESEFSIISSQGTTHFVALGRGSEVRGIRIGEARPTKIISDDVEHSDEVYNEKTRAKTNNWYFEDVTKAGDNGTNFEFVGTVLHKDSLLAKLLKNPRYESKKYKAIISWSEREDLWNKWRDIYNDISNENRLIDSEAFFEANKAEMLRGTEVLWPEKENYLDHMKDLAEIGKRAFWKEKQNDPQGEDDQIFQKFSYHKQTECGIVVESTGQLFKWSSLTPIGCIDPATGQGRQKAKGDFSCILSGYYHRQSGRVFAHHDWTKRAPPSTYLANIFELYEQFKYEKFSVETNLYRNLLMENLAEEKKRHEERLKHKIDQLRKSGMPEKDLPPEKINISFYECEQTENKKERIFRLEPKVNFGFITFSRQLSHEFVRQLEEFPNGEHDDCPDALEQLWSLANNRYKPSGILLSAMTGR